MESPEPSRLSLLKEYLGDDPLQIKEMVQLFLETYPIDLMELDRACLQGDYVKLQKTAHRLKSSVQLFDLEYAREMILEIETQAKNHGDCPNLRQLVQKFKTYMESEVKIIRKEVQQL